MTDLVVIVPCKDLGHSRLELGYDAGPSQTAEEWAEEVGDRLLAHQLLLLKNRLRFSSPRSKTPLPLP